MRQIWTALQLYVAAKLLHGFVIIAARHCSPSVAIAARDLIAEFKADGERVRRKLIAEI